MTAKKFLEKTIDTKKDATWIDPDQHIFSIEYLKKVARKMGFHAKGISTIIIY